MDKSSQKFSIFVLNSLKIIYQTSNYKFNYKSIVVHITSKDKKIMTKMYCKLNYLITLSRINIWKMFKN